VRGAAVAGIAALGLVIGIASWASFGNVAKKDPLMRRQLGSACALSILLGKHGKLVSLGNPALFVLTHRVSPSNYIYLAAGVDDWKIKHTPGGFAGWVHEIVDPKPAVVALDGWQEPHTHNANAHAMRVYLRSYGYRLRYLGGWALWIDPATRSAAKSLGVYLPFKPTRQAVQTDGEPFPPRAPCENQ
jgi:hypothetical protein